MGMGLDMFKEFFASTSPPILSIQSKEESQYTLTAASSISGVPVTLNPFDNADFVRAAVRAQLGVIRKLGAGELKEIPESVLKEVGDNIASTFRAQVTSKLPIK